MPSCPPLPTPISVQALACAPPVDLSSPLPTPAPVPVQALAGAPLVDLYTYSAPFLPDSGLPASAPQPRRKPAVRIASPILARVLRASASSSSYVSWFLAVNRAARWPHGGLGADVARMIPARSATAPRRPVDVTAVIGGRRTRHDDKALPSPSLRSMRPGSGATRAGAETAADLPAKALPRQHSGRLAADVAVVRCPPQQR